MHGESGELFLGLAHCLLFSHARQLEYLINKINNTGECSYCLDDWCLIRTLWQARCRPQLLHPRRAVDDTTPTFGASIHCRALRVGQQEINSNSDNEELRDRPELDTAVCLVQKSELLTPSLFLGRVGRSVPGLACSFPTHLLIQGLPAGLQPSYRLCAFPASVTITSTFLYLFGAMMASSQGDEMAIGRLADGPTCEAVSARLLEGQQPRIVTFFENICLSVFTIICLSSGLYTVLTLWDCVFCRAGQNDKMASDTMPSTPIYHSERPDRPIRPLPKRRLRERLSPEVADSIKYPPAPQSTPALFSYPCNLKGALQEEESGSGTRDLPMDVSGRRTPRRHGAGAEGDLDEVNARRAVVARPPTESLGRSPRLLQKPDMSRQNHQQPPPPSAASSADGYDSFENTNNKKKRKIPTAGEMNGAHGLSDHGLNDAHSVAGGVAVIPDRPGENGSSITAPYYGTGNFVSSGQNISGPGRGRFGRARNGRSPLQTLSDVSGNWSGRSPKSRPSPWSPQGQSFLPAFPYALKDVFVTARKRRATLLACLNSN